MKNFICLVLMGIVKLPVCATNQEIQDNKKQVVISFTASLTENLLEDDCVILVKRDVDLEGRMIVIPNNATLLFEGGVISNGTVVGHNTSVIGEHGFDSTIRLNGTWNCPEIQWYNIDYSGFFPVDDAINNIIAISDTIIFPPGRYLLNKTLYLKHSCVVYGNESQIISKTVDYPAAVVVQADSVRIEDLKVNCENVSDRYKGRIHGIIIEGKCFYGKGITVKNANQNAFDIQGESCILEECDALGPGYAGYRTLNVLKDRMRKTDAWCKILNCRSLLYGKKGFVNNGGMGYLIIDGFYASPRDHKSEAAILLETSESSHNYEAYIRNVVAEGIWGNCVKQKAFERVIYENCTLSSNDGASLRLHPHRNIVDGERNAYVEIKKCQLTGVNYCINGTNDVQSINYPDTLIVKDSELFLKNGSRIIDVIKNNIFVINSKLIAKNNSSTALIVRSQNVTAVEIENCEINANRVFGFSGKGKPFPQKDVFLIKNSDFPDKIFGMSKYDFSVKVIK